MLCELMFKLMFCLIIVSKPVDIDEYVMTFNDGRVVGHRALRK